jgi:hypothetical protein
VRSAVHLPLPQDRAGRGRVVIADVVSAAQHVIVGAVVWVCAVTAAAALAVAGVVCGVRAAVRARRGREGACTPAGTPNTGPHDSSAATTPPDAPGGRTAPPLWARTQPLNYGEAA